MSGVFRQNVRNTTGPIVIDGVVQSKGTIPKKLNPHPRKFASDNQAWNYARLVKPDHPARMIRKFVWRGACHATESGLTKSDLVKGADGRIKSKRAQAATMKRFKRDGAPKAFLKHIRSSSKGSKRGRSSSKGSSKRGKSVSKSPSKRGRK